MAARKINGTRRLLDARPDVLDLRDLNYAATVSGAPSSRALSEYLKARVPILDQGSAGACAGFGLATVANYLLHSRRRPPVIEPVSPWMLQEMARRYDDWADEAESGACARAAMKGWHRHGACAASLWTGPSKPTEPGLTRQRAGDAAARPLAAYFRVNHADLASLHAALSESGVLYASAMIHDGWSRARADGAIPPGERPLGCHAFAIVAYDQDGLWIQNSWGAQWGQQGFGYLSYDDWLFHGRDVWAARLGSAVRLQSLSQCAPAWTEGRIAAGHADVRPHVVCVGVDGTLRNAGPCGNRKADVEAIFANDVPRATADWPRKRILLHVAGGLDSEGALLDAACRRAQALLARQIYPITILWRTGLRSAMEDVLRGVLAQRRLADPAATRQLDSARLDDAVEGLVRRPGRLLWDDVKRGAEAAAVRANGGARLIAGHLAHLLGSDPDFELHVSVHGAGAVFAAPLLRLLTTRGQIKSGSLSGTPGCGVSARTCSFLVPACTIESFHENYLPAIASGAIGRFSLLQLRDEVEQQDRIAQIYGRSFLHLIANALESRARIPGLRDGVPLLGLAGAVAADRRMQNLVAEGMIDLILAPNDQLRGSEYASAARSHADFELDEVTLQGIVARIVGGASALAGADALARAPKDSSRRLAAV